MPGYHSERTSASDCRFDFVLAVRMKLHYQTHHNQTMNRLRQNLPFSEKIVFDL